MLLSRHPQDRTRVLIVPAIALLALMLGVFLGVGAGSAQAQQVNLPIGSTAATTAPTALYDTPALDGKMVTVLPVNGQATVLGGPFNEGWYWLKYRETEGYALGKSLVLVDANYKPVVPATPTKAATSTTVPTATSIPTSTPVPQSVSPYNGLWVGQMTRSGLVKSGPGTNTATVKSWWAGRRVILYQQITDSKGILWYRVSDPPEAPMYVQASQVKTVFAVKYEDGNRFKGRWVNVNLSQQVVIAYQDGVAVKVTLGSTGKASTPTNQGVQKLLWRLTSQRMRGGTPGVDYYDLPNVPYPQYFNNTGEALHGTYWHDDFGYPHSHGCVNLSTPMSKWFYDWDYIGSVVWVHN